MPTVQHCPSCNKPFQIPETHAGRSVRCNQCQTVFTTAAPGSDPAPGGASGVASVDDAASGLGAPAGNEGLVIGNRPAGHPPAGLNIGLADDGQPPRRSAAAPKGVFGRSEPTGNGAGPVGHAVPGGMSAGTLAGTSGADAAGDGDLEDWLDLDRVASNQSPNAAGGFWKKIKRLGGDAPAMPAAAQGSWTQRLSATGLMLVLIGMVGLICGEAAGPVYDQTLSAPQKVTAGGIAAMADHQVVALQSPQLGPAVAGEWALPAWDNETTQGPVLAVALMGPNTGGMAGLLLTRRVEDVRTLDQKQMAFNGWVGQVQGQIGDRVALEDWLKAQAEQAEPSAEGEAEAAQATAAMAKALAELAVAWPEAWVVEDALPEVVRYPVVGSMLPVVGQGLSNIGGWSLLLLLVGMGVCVTAWITGQWGTDPDVTAPLVLLGFAVLGLVLANAIGGPALRYWALAGLVLGLIVLAVGWVALAAAASQRNTVQGLLCMVGPFAPVQVATRWRASREACAWITAGLGAWVVTACVMAQAAQQGDGTGARMLAALSPLSASASMDKAEALVAWHRPQVGVDLPEVAAGGSDVDDPSLATGQGEANTSGTDGNNSVVDGQPNTHPENPNSAENEPAGPTVATTSNGSDAWVDGQGGQVLDPRDVFDGGVFDMSDAHDPSQANGNTAITDASQIPLGSLPPEIDGHADASGVVQTKTRRLTDVFEDSAVRREMRSDERQLSGYRYFVPRKLAQGLEETNFARYWQDDLPANQTVRMEVSVQTMPPSLANNILGEHPTPLLSDPDDARTNVYIAERGKITSLRLPKSKTLVYPPSNGLVFARVEPPSDGRTQTVYFVAKDGDQLLTVRLDVSVSLPDFLRQMAIMQSTVLSVEGPSSR